MAKYSFTCEKCKEEFTVSCKYEEKWDSVCPKCGGTDKKEVFKPLGHSGAQSVTERMGIQIPPPGQMPK
ncbi:MAG: FmdB family zinc ribbon protein [Clostridiales bacterium]